MGAVGLDGWSHAGNAIWSAVERSYAYVTVVNFIWILSIKNR